MATYTTTMWWMRNELDLELSELFPSEFDYYDPKNKLKFMELFYDHYFDREIGFETYSLFRHKLMAKLNLIMPKYTDMFNKQKMIIDPFNEYEEIETYTKDQKDKVKSDGSGSTSSDYTNDSSNESESITSDTPQGYLKPSDLYDHATKVDIDKNKDITKQKSSSKSDSKSNTDRESNELLDRKIQGRKTNQIDLVDKYIKLYRNLDEMIIHECRDLFMGVF